MQSLKDLIKGDMHGIHYAVSIFIATTVLWVTVRLAADTNPIWAISSMVATSDPLLKQAILTFRGRIINTLVGCATGLAFIAIAGTKDWTLPFALAATVLLSSYVVRMTTMWRQAPITAAIVIAGSLQEHLRMGGLEEGLRRVAEVLFGCVVGLVVSWLLSKIWPVPESSAKDPP